MPLVPGRRSGLKEKALQRKKSDVSRLDFSPHAFPFHLHTNSCPAVKTNHTHSSFFYPTFFLPSLWPEDAVALIIRKGYAQFSSITLPARKGLFNQQSAPFFFFSDLSPVTFHAVRLLKKYHTALVHTPSLRPCHISEPYCKTACSSPLVLSPCVCIFSREKRRIKGHVKYVWVVCLSAMSIK